MLIKEMYKERDRCRELTKLYDPIPGGSIGGAMIAQAMKNVEKAIESSDVLEMLRAYQELKETEGQLTTAIHRFTFSSLKRQSQMEAVAHSK